MCQSWRANYLQPLEGHISSLKLSVMGSQLLGGTGSFTDASFYFLPFLFIYFLYLYFFSQFVGTSEVQVAKHWDSQAFGPKIRNWTDSWPVSSHICSANWTAGYVLDEIGCEERSRLSDGGDTNVTMWIGNTKSEVGLE